ncbi:muramoyltetrapeptide carboxypeptidase [Clostridium punense]|uniref:Muramoyltetrapeptide carboxypeptidase n=1 Tax=Clostridium punense TaxID=1054297 RepID=A0ABS4JZN9_9CLOT|nr:muramoyltetrapeptide carboxypeptidase [Clostridium punense]
MIKPRPLKNGDTVGIVAPSSPTRNLDSIEKSVKVLEEQGFKVEVGDSCRDRYGHLSGSDEVRARDINKMFWDKSIQGIFCIRGGYGTPRILDMLDYDNIRKNPKIFLGYSDITAIHIALNQICNLVTFHGPMTVSDMIDDFDSFSKESYLKAITSTEPLGNLSNPSGVEIKSLNPGTAQGKIVGGNLSLIASTMGTPFEINTKGKILLIEDIGEYTYAIDRMLTQLKLAGKFEDCNGIILGDFRDCEPEHKDYGLSLMQVFKDIIVPANKPTIYNVMAGHCNPKLTIPLGVEAQVNGDNCSVAIIENALNK